MKTQVLIIGGGPSGLMLSRILSQAGISSVILERQSRDHVLSRIRAGVLEQQAVDLLESTGLGTRMQAEGFVHHGIELAWEGHRHRVDFGDRPVMVYGQTEVTKDLYDGSDADAVTILHEVSNIELDLNGPGASFSQGGQRHEITCELIAGCDGYHGVSRRAIPADRIKLFERIYPFGWLGVLSETPPVAEELIYANHPRGFALASMRNAMLSRYYIQVPASEDPADWSDDAFWDELRRRLPAEAAESLVTGPSIEKSAAPLRSFVAEPMQYGPLYLCGDAAHIVPPTGAKGLNLAMSDVQYLAEGIIAAQSGDRSGLEHYSTRALARVWKAVRFSWWFTTTMHRFPDQSDFDQRMQESELAVLSESAAARKVLVENYSGLPL
ncbi:4-hydroxybenzoate 3-monooxygenase [Pontivivens ytuae]|uniref:4-hydroxybenzoate 3-monooxygenase n=1 Tax=Pontivivens ytuae TaxID=2789856 RepID=A0A7S9LUJ7_9RHOB|nr:4-hydroxybenzoate 3-monooxygenase [Pontivivens ytuae]QPH55527.1 4-hydroxybenzoate 3-monooxygenase [Pontivivens ytuae]